MDLEGFGIDARTSPSLGVDCEAPMVVTCFLTGVCDVTFERPVRLAPIILSGLSGGPIPPHDRVTQLDRVLDYGSRCHGFKSHRGFLRLVCLFYYEIRYRIVTKKIYLPY